MVTSLRSVNTLSWLSGYMTSSPLAWCNHNHDIFQKERHIPYRRLLKNSSQLLRLEIFSHEKRRKVNLSLQWSKFLVQVFWISQNANIFYKQIQIVNVSGKSFHDNRCNISLQPMAHLEPKEYPHSNCSLGTLRSHSCSFFSRIEALDLWTQSIQKQIIEYDIDSKFYILKRTRLSIK